MKVHTHLAEKDLPEVTERADATLVAESLAFARRAAVPRTGSVTQPAPVALGRKPPAAGAGAAGAVLAKAD
jgi:hypothetical protein